MSEQDDQVWEKLSKSRRLDLPPPRPVLGSLIIDSNDEKSRQGVFEPGESDRKNKK